MIVFLNGKFLEEKVAKVSVFDHGFLYGDGIYETLRTYQGKIWNFEEHFQRLEQSARLTALQLPWSQKQIFALLEKLLKLNGFAESRIRITVTRGNNNFDFSSCLHPSLLIVVQELNLEPAWVYAKGVDVITVKLQRVLPEVKSISLFPFIVARQAIQKEKAYEAFFVNERGFVTEGTMTNFFIVRKNVLLTPKNNILIGTTRKLVLQIARKLRLKSNIIDLTVADLRKADEIFISNAPRGIIPVRKLNGRLIGNGKPGVMTKEIMKKFVEITNEL